MKFKKICASLACGSLISLSFNTLSAHAGSGWYDQCVADLQYLFEEHQDNRLLLLCQCLETIGNTNESAAETLHAHGASAQDCAASAGLHITD
jgi:hypothetical protein